MRRLVAAAVSGVFLCVWSSAPAESKVPVEVSFSSGSRSVIVRDPALTELFVRHLCSGEAAAQAPTGRSIVVAAQWSGAIVWTGRLFPSHDGRPAVVDIPQWRLSSSDSTAVATCALRSVPERLESTLTELGITSDFFDAPSVTTVVAPAPTPATDERSRSGWILGFAGIGVVGGAIGLVALARTVLVRVPAIQRQWTFERDLLRAARSLED